MKLNEILLLVTTKNNLKADSKKVVFETISKLIAAVVPTVDETIILNSLVAREKLGSTAIGHGVAIPHSRIKNIEQPIAALVCTQQAMDFDAPDHQLTDLFFGLLVPEQAKEQHLAILANVAEKFSDKKFREKLRLAKTDQELYQVAIGD